MVTVTNPESYTDADTGKLDSHDFTIGVDAFGPVESPLPPFVDEAGKDLFPRALRKLGPLAPGEIYGFVPALSMGGAPRLENLKKVPIREHLAMLVSLEPSKLYDYLASPDTFGHLEPVRPLGALR